MCQPVTVRLVAGIEDVRALAELMRQQGIAHASFHPGGEIASLVLGPESMHAATIAPPPPDPDEESRREAQEQARVMYAAAVP